MCKGFDERKSSKFLQTSFLWEVLEHFPTPQGLSVTQHKCPLEGSLLESNMHDPHPTFCAEFTGVLQICGKGKGNWVLSV